MRTLGGLLVISSLALALVACGGSEPPPPVPPPPPPAPVAEVNSAPPPAAEPSPAPQPTAEEKAKAEALRKMQEDEAKWQGEHKAEVARWTPELHAAAKALADKAYPSGRAAIQAALAGKQRKPGAAERDASRHPVDTLAFFGLTPTMTVLEVGPGEGWYTELLAPALATKGKLLDTTGDPNGPDDQRSTIPARHFHALLDEAPELFGKVQTVVVNSKTPSLGLDGTVDMVLLMREVHGMVGNGTLTAWLDTIHKALKPHGILGIEEHRERPGADRPPEASAKLGYVPEKWLIEQVEAAGFKLAGKSEVNANPKDTKDYEKGVWALPPTFENGDADRAKYAAIGESDRMTLKFVKAPAPAAPHAK